AAKGGRLGLTATFRHGFGEVGEQDGEPEPYGDAPGEPERLRTRRTEDQVPDPDCGREEAADLHHEHDRVADHDPQGEPAERIQESLPENRGLEGRNRPHPGVAHQKVLPEAARKCSTTGPRARAGKKVSAPTIRTTPIRRPTKSGPWVGNVPGPTGAARFSAMKPPIARAGMIIQNRPASMARPRVVLYQVVFAFKPAK